MKKLKKVAKALNKASRLHKKQSKVIKKHIKEMKRGTRANTKQFKKSNQKKSRNISHIGYIRWG